MTMAEKEAKRLVRCGLRSLTDEHVRNLMEAADDGVPILLSDEIRSAWICEGVG